MSQSYFLDAVLQCLRSSPVATTLGDTWDPATQAGVQKIGAEFLIVPPLPYLVIEEPGEDRTYFTIVAGQTPRPFLAEGTFTMMLACQGRSDADRIGDLIASVLHDASISWIGGRGMYLRLMTSRFSSTSDPGPDSPTVFARLMTFNFMYQGGV